MRDSNLFSQNQERSFHNNVEANTYGQNDSSFQFQQAEDNRLEDRPESQMESESKHKESTNELEISEDNLFVKYKQNCKQILDNLAIED